MEVRASTSALLYSCIIEKERNFTHLSHKTAHISPSKIVHIYTFATATVHIYTVTVDVHPIILLISQFRTFFSLSLLRVQNELSLRLLLSSFAFSLDTHKYTHINTLTQTHTQRQINTKIHKYTNMDKPIQRERDWCWHWLLVDRWVGANGRDQSL